MARVKVEKVVNDPQVRIERGDVIIEADARITRLLMATWEAKLIADDAKKAYDEAAEALKAALADAFGPCSVVADGICRAIYTLPTRVSVKYPETLQAILADRYNDLVKVEEKVSPTDALIALATDADYTLAPAIAAALTITHSESLRVIAEKPAKGAR